MRALLPDGAVCYVSTATGVGGLEVRRRDFIQAVIGPAIAWPLAAHAQQQDDVRRIGVLLNLAADDPEAQAIIAAFKETLQQIGRASCREREWKAAIEGDVE